MIINDKIEKALAVLPHKPGVYLAPSWRDCLRGAAPSFEATGA